MIFIRTSGNPMKADAYVSGGIQIALKNIHMNPTITSNTPAACF